jgi:hypothetical protein
LCVSDVSLPHDPDYDADMSEPEKSAEKAKALTPAARRALAEAQARHAAAEAAAKAARPVEHQGPNGPEPTRFGDWERKGIATDF